MASIAKQVRAGAGSTAVVTEDANKAQWWLRFNNGVPADGGDDKEEGEREGAERRATYAVAGYAEAEEMHDGRAEMVARGGGKAEVEAAGVGGKSRSSSRFADPAALDEEINYLEPAELPRRRRKKAIAKRTKLNVSGTEVQNIISQVVKGPERDYEENENLKLQLALKTAELKQEENRRFQLELILKSKEIEHLKAENEQLRKNAKPKRVERLCRSCGAYVMHDYRNCPKRREVASSPEEEAGQDTYTKY